MLLTHKARWLATLVILCIVMVVACQAAEPEDEPSTTPIANGVATASPTQRPTLTPSPTATLTRTTTPPPPPTPTPTAEPSSTPIPDPAYILPEGWQALGNSRLGLQVAAPVDWLDVSDQARDADWIADFGPQILLAVESQQTGVNVLAGQPLAGGGFVFGFVSDSILPSVDPAAGLLSLLGDAGLETALAYQRVALELTDLPAAYVDLEGSPLSQFEVEGQRLAVRLMSVTDLEHDKQVFFVFGTEADQWGAYEETFAQMLHTVVLNPVVAAVGQQLRDGDQVKGELSQSADQIWPFNGRGGQYATITLAPEDSAIDMTLALVDPDGNIMVSVDDGYAGDLEVLTDVLLPGDGTYIIEVGEFFKEAGQYQLGLALADEPQFGGGGRIDFGRKIDSELPENGEHIWVFGGTAGQEVSLVLTSLSDQLDVILEVRGPDGQEELVLDEGFAGDAEVVTGIELDVTGEYMIIVRGFAGHGGPYSLVLDEGGESTVNFYDAGDLIYGQDARDFLRQDEAHAWFFEGSAGDQVTIEVSPLGSNLDLDIWLLDPQLNDVAMKDEFLAGEPEKIEEALQSDGQYLVLVREFFGEPGEYEIRLNAGGEDLLEVAGSISYSEVVSGTLPAGRNVGWLFEGRAGEIVNIMLAPTEPDRDLVIVLLDPQGETVASIDTALSGLPERLSSFRITEDGQWMILIQEFFNEGSGYELSLTRQQ